MYWAQNVEHFSDLSAASNLYFTHWLFQSNLTVVALIALYVQAFFAHRLWVRLFSIRHLHVSPNAEDIEKYLPYGLCWCHSVILFCICMCLGKPLRTRQTSSGDASCEQCWFTFASLDKAVNNHWSMHLCILHLLIFSHGSCSTSSSSNDGCGGRDSLWEYRIYSIGVSCHNLHSRGYNLTPRRCVLKIYHKWQGP
jgi:hypothetical protein